MQKKLVVLFVFVLLAFVALSWRLVHISQDNGESYKKRVLSQQVQDSRVLPFKRGEILDRKGSKLAYSEKVYNLVVDSKMLLADDGNHVEPTFDAIHKCFPEVNTDEIRSFAEASPSSRYRVFAKNLTWDEMDAFEKLRKKSVSSGNASKKSVSSGSASSKKTIQGVWFEDAYLRRYPFGTLGCNLLGFVNGENLGNYGLEGYYNTTLDGVNGRQYGYLNEDSIAESTMKIAEDGDTLITTIDTNIQTIVEKHIKRFMDEHKNAYREGAACENIGVIVMNPKNGEIYAMATYPVFDPNDPLNEDVLSEVDVSKFLPKAYQEGGVSGNAVSGNQAYDEAWQKAKSDALGSVWRNFCISDSYEPGSVMKPFTVAGALDSGKITGEETYNCGGYLEVGDYQIHCHNRLGDGLLTVKQGVAKSCNVVLMNIAFAMGKEEWLRYNRIFNFGLKTNIDLYGESNAGSLTFDESMGTTDLAVASFGQGFNVTMIQMATGFSALVNGGYYYQPRVVSEIKNADGAVVEEKHARLVKQVISEATSAKMRDYLKAVVMSDPSECTGWSARPAGYSEGGKTGTAEMYPRDGINYLISFMGYVPADDPEVLCYVVIDRPNTALQGESTRLATVLNKEIMTEVLPYLNIFMTEELTDEEREELSKQESMFASGISENSAGEGEAGEEAPAEDGDEDAIVIEEEPPRTDSGGNIIGENEILYDPETGYPLDPATGEVLDPETLQPVNPSSDLPEVKLFGEFPEGENP
ncbi:MAG: cell division protein FtsI [Lachnospiraceae bacterium]|nr:cell division protein FtsI [Lachnospiraceae bacterium]